MVRAMIWLQYATTLALVVARALPYTCALAVIACLPLSRAFSRALRRPRPAERPKHGRLAEVWPLWFSAFGFVHSARFGVLLVVGLGAGVALQAAGLPVE